MKKDRVVYFEYLRVFAIIAVVIIHVAAQNIKHVSFQSFDWHVFNVYDSAVRWGVPVFLMISGALFLSREIETKQLYSKYIARLAISYCVWSLFYTLAIPLCEYFVHKDSSVLYSSIAKMLVNGTYHLWFLPMIIGLYMCVPIIRQIVQQKETSRYFLIISFIFAFIIPFILNLACQFGGGVIKACAVTISNVISDMKMDIVMGYAFYFVLGYVLNRIEMRPKQRGIIYVLGGFAFLLTIVLTALATRMEGTFYAKFYDYFSVTVVLEAVSVHTWFRYRKYGNEKLTYVMAWLSKHSFSAYLVHVFVLKVLQVIGLNTMSFSPALSVPVISGIVLVLSFAISFVLDFVRKLFCKKKKQLC